MSETTKEERDAIRYVKPRCFMPERVMERLCNDADNADTARQEAAKLKGVLQRIAHGNVLDKDCPKIAQDALHSSDAPASEPMKDEKVQGICLAYDKGLCLGSDGRDLPNPYPPASDEARAFQYGYSHGIKRDPAPADRPKPDTNLSASINSGDSDTHDPAPADRPEPRQMDQATADHLGERIRQARDSALSSSPEGHPETDAASEALEEALAAASFEGMSPATERMIRRAISQPAPAVPEAQIAEARRLLEKSAEPFDKACSILRSLPADGDSPAVPDGWIQPEWQPISTYPRWNNDPVSAWFWHDDWGLLRGYIHELPSGTNVSIYTFPRGGLALYSHRQSEYRGLRYWMPKAPLPAAPTPDEDGE